MLILLLVLTCRLVNYSQQQQQRRQQQEHVTMTAIEHNNWASDVQAKSRQLGCCNCGLSFASCFRFGLFVFVVLVNVIGIVIVIVVVVVVVVVVVHLLCALVAC